MPIVHVPLTQGKVALIDEEDAERVLAFKWYAHFQPSGGNGGLWYAGRTIVGGGKGTLHRFILGTPPGIEIDHKNRDGLDCRRENLRTCSSAQNRHNTILNSRNTSGFKGASWHCGHRKWQAVICVEGKQIFLGRFPTVEEAALAYDEAARIHFGEFGRYNFPRDDERSAR